MIVMKFGGSSVSDAGRIRAAGEIVRGRLGRRPVVVVSAFRGVTDELLGLAKDALRGDLSRLKGLRKRHEDTAAELGVDFAPCRPLFDELESLAKGVALLKELTPRTLDHAASFGERLSCRLIAAAWAKAGLPARAVDAPDAGLLTDARFGAANPLPEGDAAIRTALGGASDLPVVTGFIGRAPSGDIATLGRNGSDYSATILGAALGAEVIEIWSDTDGVMTADPRLVPAAKPLAELTFDEAGELAYYGGKVLHPHTLVPAVKKGIPVGVLNTFKPDHPGTRIAPARPGAAAGPRSIAFKRHLSVVTVKSPDMLMGWGFLARIFAAFAKHEIVVDMVTTSEVTVSCTVDDPSRVDRAVAELGGEFTVAVETGRAVICVVGEGLRDMPGLAADAFGALKDAGVNVLMISQGASKINLAFVVADADVPRAVTALHSRFF